MRQWRLMYGSPTGGARNMAVDETLLLRAVPTLRLYAWEPYCLSLGYGQHVAEVDRARLATAGWSLVRRPSGGRAILHAQELTYSLVLPADHPLVQGSVVESYRRLSAALRLGLRRLGAAVEALPGQTTQHHGPACFDQPSHYEICVGGRKLVGSAQLRRADAVLQHGSIPLAGDIAAICEVLRYPDERSRKLARDEVRSSAVTLSDALGYTVTWDDAAEALATGFQQTFDLEFIESDLGEAEAVEVERLCAQVYNDPAWTQRR